MLSGSVCGDGAEGLCSGSWLHYSILLEGKKDSVGPVHTQEGELNKGDPCVGEAPWVYGAVLGLGSSVTIG